MGLISRAEDVIGQLAITGGPKEIKEITLKLKKKTLNTFLF